MKTNFVKRLWIGLGVIVASIAIIAGAIVYMAYRLQADSAQLVSQRAAAQANAVALDRLAELEKDAPTAQAYQAAVATLLPSQNQLINIPVTVEQLGQSDGVSAAMTFQGNPSPSRAGYPGSEQFSLQAQGPLTNLGTFIGDMESSSAFLANVSSFNVTAAPSGGYQLTAQGMVFFN